MKEPGVNIIFNGHIYHFNEPAGLDMLLDQTADSVSETDRDNAVLYDDELNLSQFKVSGGRPGEEVEDEIQKETSSD